MAIKHVGAILFAKNIVVVVVVVFCFFSFLTHF